MSYPSVRYLIWGFGLLSLGLMLAAADPCLAAVTISTAQTSNMTCANGVCAPTASVAVLNVTDLENLLASGNVEITTTGSGVQADDIDLAAGLSWSNANGLTLDAHRSISISQPLAVGGSSAISLATNDGGSGGTLSFISGGSLSFASTTNSLSINSKSYTLEDSISSLASAVASKPSGA